MITDIKEDNFVLNHVVFKYDTYKDDFPLIGYSAQTPSVANNGPANQDIIVESQARDNTISEGNSCHQICVSNMSSIRRHSKM